MASVERVLSESLQIELPSTPLLSTTFPFILLFNGITMDGNAIATASNFAMLSSALGMAELTVVVAVVVLCDEDTLVDSNCIVDHRLVFAGVHWFCVLFSDAFSLLHVLLSVFW